jgi:hypothetical protein
VPRWSWRCDCALPWCCCPVRPHGLSQAPAGVTRPHPDRVRCLGGRNSVSAREETRAGHRCSPAAVTTPIRCSCRLREGRGSRCPAGSWVPASTPTKAAGGQLGSEGSPVRLLGQQRAGRAGPAAGRRPHGSHVAPRPVPPYPAPRARPGSAAAAPYPVGTHADPGGDGLDHRDQREQQQRQPAQPVDGARGSSWVSGRR